MSTMPYKDSKAKPEDENATSKKQREKWAAARKRKEHCVYSVIVIIVIIIIIAIIRSINETDCKIEFQHTQIICIHIEMERLRNMRESLPGLGRNILNGLCFLERSHLSIVSFIPVASSHFTQTHKSSAPGFFSFGQRKSREFSLVLPLYQFFFFCLFHYYFVYFAEEKMEIIMSCKRDV